MPKTRGGKSKGNNRNRHSSTQRANSASRRKSTTISIQRWTSDATAISTHQQDAVSSFTSPFISTLDNHAPMSTTARPLTVNNISCIVREVVKYLHQLQGQQLTASQPADTALTYSGDQVCSTPQEVTTTYRVVTKSYAATRLDINSCLLVYAAKSQVLFMNSTSIFVGIPWTCF